MDESQKDIVKKIKLKMRIGLVLIVVVGLAIAVYFIFLKKEANTNIIPICGNAICEENENDCIPSCPECDDCGVNYCPADCEDQNSDANINTSLNANILSENDPNGTVLSESAQLKIQTYTGLSCEADGDCGIFPCVDNECLIKKCTCSCNCSGNICGGDDSEAPGYCISSTASDTIEIDTSDWLMYENEEWGFEMEYPGSYILFDNQRSPDLYMVYFEYPGFGLGRGCSVSVIETDISDFIDNVLSYGVTDEGTVTINELQWRFLTYDPQDDPSATDQSKVYTYLIERDGNTYKVGCNIDVTSSEITLEEINGNVDQIIDSFRFTI